MIKEDFETKLEELIKLFDLLLTQEDFSAYKQLKSGYSNLYHVFRNAIQIEQIQASDFEKIMNSFRILMEAPPKDIALGKQILDKMQEIYILQKSISAGER